MNAFLGSTEPNWKSAANKYWNDHRQMLKDCDIESPARIWVTVDEHPDSINDGYFLTSVDPSWQYWIDLPASYHSGAAGFSFADGHSEIHRWLFPSTKQEVAYTPFDGSPLQAVTRFPYPANESGDHDWVAARSSERR